MKCLIKPLRYLKTSALETDKNQVDRNENK